MYMTVSYQHACVHHRPDPGEQKGLEGRIRAVHDGEQYLVNTSQFETHFQQLELAKQALEEWQMTPIPDDVDIKDED